MEFRNQVVLITGGSRGIGAATARLFAELGADVAINYYANKPDAEKVKADIVKMGRKCLIVKADAGKRADCENLVKATIDEFGKLDILVNNAGAGHVTVVVDGQKNTTRWSKDGIKRERQPTDDIWDGRRGGIETALEINVDGAVEDLVGHILDGRLGPDAGIVD